MTMNGSLSVFDISGRAMSAQLVRLNTTASNLANAGTTAGSEATAYRAMKPVFRTVMDEQGRATVQVDQVTQTKMTPTKKHDPNNPLADADGNVWEAAVDSAAELVEMVETARQYQNNVQVLETAKGLINETLRMGQ
ncbi:MULTISPECIES: flagellar basal body rod protein FlgC [unclassified Sphingopyxis]|uniref:flagellar basal body rod protein FlgC n=1 Tax=unclassified Sphingopyxis TaxID=2614943 RepID=UPI000736985B|nr:MULTISPECIES: flagellar basal body rod protein FlgC [unclassified Sphingopyxis]KTE41083.1 flagellar basal-body rod protein FlgC [Sphingopyxis sp. HIX]KTE84243.1 flagellar basal-body rod protein FlgC [Sphingopyxis sp. HXXIV]